MIKNKDLIEYLSKFPPEIPIALESLEGMVAFYPEKVNEIFQPAKLLKRLNWRGDVFYQVAEPQDLSDNLEDVLVCSI